MENLELFDDSDVLDDNTFVITDEEKAQRKSDNKEKKEVKEREKDRQLSKEEMKSKEKIAKSKPKLAAKK